MWKAFRATLEGERKLPHAPHEHFPPRRGLLPIFAALVYLRSLVAYRVTLPDKCGWRRS
jgi:hypothetical protein